MKKILSFALSLALIACQNNEKVKTFSEQTSAQEVPVEQTDAEKRLEKYVPVKLTTNVSKLTENQRLMIPSLIKVCQIMDGLFWKQAFGQKEEFLESISNESTRRFAEINYGPWDRLDGNKSFVKGVGEKPLGANYYPKDMTQEPYLKFDKDGSINAHGGCNTIMGNYELGLKNFIEINEVSQTEMECSFDSFEKTLVEALTYGKQYLLVGEDQLQIIVGKRAPLARFKAVYF
ncbi:META domain-containing protein [Vicingaceae bacterium]|nr:META domain-containing protein [Vicingaceae bacterium]